MKTKKTIILSIVSILLMAFPITAFAATNTYPDASSTKAYPSQLSIAGSSSTTSSTDTFASSGLAISSSTQTIAPRLLRDKAYVDYAHSYLMVSKDFPTKVEAVIVGWLPNPCHILQISVGSFSTANTINIQVYSLYDPSQVCVDLLQPFKSVVSLGSFGKGLYTVVVNGTKIGEFGVSVPTLTTINPVKSISTSVDSSIAIQR